MKTKPLFATVLFALAAFTSARGQNIVNIPDPNFKNYLLSHWPQIDKDGDGEISEDEAAAVQWIYCDSWDIHDLTGIEAFVNLTELNCSDNYLTTLDLSSNTALKKVYCEGKYDQYYFPNLGLTSLDISNNTALTYLDCQYNRLTDLDVSNNTALTYLDCSDNQLTDLDVSNNTALTELACSNNQLTNLDVSQNMALTNLYCTLNQLTELFPSNNPVLKRLDCNDNPLLTTLDVSLCTALEILYCNASSGSQLTELDLTNNTALTLLSCDWNQLTELDLTNNTALTYLRCQSNELTSLDLTNNMALTLLSCDWNQLTELDLTNNTALTELACAGNQLTELDLTNNTALTGLYCEENPLTELDLSQCTALKELYCNDNQLTSLDLSQCTALVDLWGFNNSLISLNLKNGNNANLSIQVTDNPDLRCIQVDDVAYANANWESYKDAAACFSESGCVPAFALVPPICTGDAFALPAAADEGTTGAWTPSIMDTSTPGTQTLVFAPAVGECALPTTWAFTVNPLPVVGLGADKDLICAGESIKLTASGVDIDTYAWTGAGTAGSVAGQIVTPAVGTNIYKVTGTDTKGCTSEEKEVEITVKPKPIVDLIASDTPVCAGEEVVLSASPASGVDIDAYAWAGAGTAGSGAVQNVTPAIPTIYKVTGTGSNGCTSDEKEVTVTVNPKPLVVLTSDADNDAVCAGQSATLTATGNATSYSWNNNLGSGTMQTVSPAIATTYQVTGTNSSGCSDTKSLTIAVNPVPVVTLSPNQTICAGESVVLAAGGAATYAWDNGLGGGDSHTVSPTITTTYKVTGTSGKGCLSYEKEVTVKVNAKPTVVLTPNQTICAGESVVLAAGGAATYAWDNGLGGGDSHTVSPTITTTYKVSGMSGKGCLSYEKEVTVTVNQKTTPVFDLPASLRTDDVPPVLPVSSQKGIAGAWNPSAIDVSAVGVKTYTFTPNAGECADGYEHTVEVVLGILPIAAADDVYRVSWSGEDKVTDGSVLDNDSFDGSPIDLTKVRLTLIAASDPDLQMLPNGTIRIAAQVRPGVYSYRYRICEVQNPTNCQEALATIEMQDNGPLFVPNAFTPNGDGVNDTFEILGFGNYERIDLTVFSQYGDLVYRNEDYRNEWTGSGLKSGTYYYNITAAYKGGRSVMLKGWVLLIDR